jgi:hypothetical protein
MLEYTRYFFVGRAQRFTERGGQAGGRTDNPGHPPLPSAWAILQGPSASAVRQMDWLSADGQPTRTFVRMRPDDVLRM